MSDPSTVDPALPFGDGERIENRTYDEIALGESAQLVRTLTARDIELFAVMSGDVNPAHVDEAFAKDDLFHRIVAHGMWGGALISTVLGTQLPGPGTIYVDQSLHFRRPVGIGDTLTVSVRATTKIDATHRVIFDCRAVNQDGRDVITGTAEVIAPTEKIARPRVRLPEVALREPGRRLRELIARCAGLAPLRTAVVHPVDAVTVAGALAAARAGLIVPVLIGPAERIRAAAAAAHLELGAIEIVPTEHSDAAAATAVELARAGRVQALMKGALHTEEFMHPVVAAERGLRTGRRMSHLYATDIPGYDRLVFLTDAAVNVTPSLDDKRDIVQNAIDVASALGVPAPRVAILSAVETVNDRLRSTLDAAALCKMAERGQITGGRLDGPLAFDDAVSPAAAAAKGLGSAVAGNADVLVVPDLEAGNLLAKQLEYLADARVAGFVTGARVPIVLTSRADDTLARLAASAIALLVARSR